MSVTVQAQELLYEATFQLTGETNFGVDLQSALSGAVPVPPEGLRFDIPFAGEVKGPKVKGTIEGIDYVVWRGDGIGILHIHAVITTDDGERIAFFGEGVSTPQPDSPTIELRESVRLQTASPKYAWVNRVHVWATGSVDLGANKAVVKAYVA